MARAKDVTKLKCGDGHNEGLDIFLKFCRYRGMDFQALVGKTMSEVEWMELFVTQFQQNFNEHQNIRHFIKLKKMQTNESQIEWIRSYTDPYAFADFMFDTPTMRASIMTRFEHGRHVVSCSGHTLQAHFLVWKDRVVRSPLRHRSPDRDVEKEPMVSRELVRMMGEFHKEVAVELKAQKLVSRKPKAV